MPFDRDPRGGAPALILIAQEPGPARDDLRAALHRAGYATEEASTLDQALTRCRVADPDLTIVDVDLWGNESESSPFGAPRPDTLLVTRLIEARDRPGLPVITVSRCPTDAAPFLRAGARDHVRAPIELGEIEARISVALADADQQEALIRRTERLEHLGAIDELTGLATRAQIEDQLGRLGATAQRHHLPLAAVLIGIDNCDAMRGGDRRMRVAVVREVATLLQSVTRTNDVAGRFAETEFLILLPMTDTDGASRWAGRALRAIAAAPIITNEGPIEITVSAGCAGGLGDPDELLWRVDLALREAQVAGRSRLVAVSLV